MTFKLRTWGGIGDVLLLTPSVRAFKKAHPTCKLKVYCSDTSHFEVLRHNPHIDVLALSPLFSRRTRFAEAISGFLNTSGALKRTVAPFWQRRRPRTAPYAVLLPIFTRRHAIRLIAEMLDIDPVDHPLEIFLTGEEERRGSLAISHFRNPVVIQTTSITSTNKSWPLVKWEALVQRNPQCTFIQVGLSAEPRVAGAVDLRGRTTIRESFALIKSAAAFVGVESSLGHAANACGTPGVVLFGPTAPEVWAHPTNRTITSGARCAPCIDLLMDFPCPYGATCMTDIAVEQVEAALRDQIRPSTVGGRQRELVPVVTRDAAVLAG